MATRGTALLLKKDRILESVEFNGDMYPDGHGDEFFEGLSKVENTEDFQKFLNNFNDKNFQYDDDNLIYQLDNEDFYSGRGRAYKHVDLVRNRVVNSDWIFIKNLTGERIGIEAISDNKSKLTQIQPGETLRFHFDSFPEDGIAYRI